MSRRPAKNETQAQWQELDLGWEEVPVREAVKKAIDKLGGIDWLVVSSGLGAYLGPFEMDRKRMRELMQINFHGPVEVYLAARKYLAKSQGKVLFVSSTVATRGARGMSGYAATKGALNSFLLSEVRSAVKLGITMNVLSPGWVDTEMTQEIKEEIKQVIVKSIPIRRMAAPEEVADFAIKILETPPFLTGQILEMSGGA